MLLFNHEELKCLVHFVFTVGMIGHCEVQEGSVIIIFCTMDMNTVQMYGVNRTTNKNTKY